ncbi:23S rRNA (uracil-5-)-methyltransferase RumA [Natranaerovirga hydrolytica]|uniref:23S rRNA (Uracil-5-)-methyltransferase RumA n=1 Tax=Natranaerovirga hydrolytica TaxID=680378 RepID=A0A4R1MIR4_9FIRM|nr:23S rRNA (uracil(1939)-C(5))-methyltransferase RlmD [Natranaerovirga hydrolytica]TCK92556.1 23S rRNA (uracil-5-)-methyltransferase RumA [Natranaerovirga hydrolytica]
MKKKEIYEGLIEKTTFPNKGIIKIDEHKVTVKQGIKGQKVKLQITKAKRGKFEGRILEVLEQSDVENRVAPCDHFGPCGGCFYQTLTYDHQLEVKKNQVLDLLNDLDIDYEFEGIEGSPSEWCYRNKMEYSFGDEYKEGPLALGLHKKASLYDIVTTTQCKIVDNDFNKVLQCVLNYFSTQNIPYYRKRDHIGYLRNLVVRKGIKPQELLINLVTSSQLDLDLTELIEALTSLELEGKIAGILHTFNDNLADTVQNDRMSVLYGQEHFYEEVLGLKFRISPFSFFQTNSLGAEVLYSIVRDYVGETKDKVIFDLYSGTGTIAQILAPVANKVVGVEIVEEAVEAAKENAKLNHLNNCEFIAGDVLKVIDELKDKPDVIVLDPPRDGIHPKALKKIIEFGVDQIVYVSCKPTSLVRDLEVFIESGYEVKKVRCVDMFPQTVHVETIVALYKKD